MGQRTCVLLLMSALLAAGDDSGFLAAMKTIMFGNEQTNRTSQDSIIQPAPPTGGYSFHQYQTSSRQLTPSGSSCTLPQQIGTGPYRIPRWYFNPARGRCELFYWSGCCGNGNNFQTFQSCQNICEVDPCSQEKEAGVGAVQLPRFFFNKETRICEEFQYFGGGGNRNNFQTLQECQTQCPESPNPCAVATTGPLTPCNPGANTCGVGYYCHVGATTQTTVCCPKPSAVDKCQQPLNIGIGNANVQRWYFNPLTQQCQACTYRGLQGNENNFLSKQECEQSCLINPCRIGTPYRSQGVTVQCSASNPAVCPAGYYCHVGADASTSVCCQAIGGDPCGQPLDRGQGGSQLTRWYWNMQGQCCQPFSYCGMKGTQNNFLSQQDCERTCYELDNPCALGEPQMGSDNRPLQCSLQANTCDGTHWCHFGANQATTVCCPGKVEGTAICQQPMTVGTGDANLPRWYYDQTTRQCKQFFYKGRTGNQNNFLSEQDCAQLCPVFVNVCPSGTPQLDNTGRPIPCTFGTDSCDSSHWCHLGLVPDEYQCCPGTPAVPGACQGLPFSEGELGAAAPPATRYYYDQSTMSCKEFIYNGRKGNQNNFLTKEDCEATCNVFTNPCNQPIPLPPQTCSVGGNTCGTSSWCHIGATPDTTVCCPSEGDPCLLPLARGDGNQFMDRWYYNQQTATCQPFTYAGLHGNQNNFLSRQDCDEQCGPNPCFEGRPFAGIDGRPQTCSSSANLNTCPLNHWCHIGSDMSTTVCCPGAATNICNLPMSTGEGNANLERFYFDQSTRTCRPFTYNGLKGNQNNFITLRACQLACQPLDNPCIGQPATTAAGQVLFCSATNKDACPVNFWCHLGATPETTVCCPGATNPCSVPLAPGTGNARLGRWYYNPDERQCIGFQYNGMRGNQNNFLNQNECERTCPEELCLLSIDRGACGGSQTRYAFNRQTSQCVPFTYTGCGGNLNNFVSMADCMATCGKVGFRR